MDDDDDEGMYGAINANDVIAVGRRLTEHPDELTVFPGMAPTWLHYAAQKGKNKVIDIFLKAGLAIDYCTQQKNQTPLACAVGYGQLDTARYLLSLKADPNKGRILISAINSSQCSFELVKLLVEHRIDVNQSWRFGDQKTGPIFNALSWAESGGKKEIADYLRAHGARLPTEDKTDSPQTMREEIIAYFAREFGPVNTLSLGEILPGAFPVEIHVVPAAKNRDFATLFTTGMSSQPMIVPPGQDAFRFAELLIYLPAEWPLNLEALRDSTHRWPIDWLKKIAAYPHQQKTWLGGPIAIISNGSPPKTLSADCRFTSMLLVTGFEKAKAFKTTDAKLIQLYTLLPLYPEEHAVEQKHGLPELFRRFDRMGMPKVLDPNRRNFAKL